MSELIDTTEMYLKTVYELEEDGVTPLRARIVDRLDHSGPTVSQTVARMERDGLIRVTEDRSLELTDEGRRRATEVIRKHRLAERLLLDVVGLDRRYIHDEACRWEHVMSERVEDRLAEILGDVASDPFGNPIPGSRADHPAPGKDELSANRVVRDGVRSRPTPSCWLSWRTPGSALAPRWSCADRPGACASWAPRACRSCCRATSPATSSSSRPPRSAEPPPRSRISRIDED